jgi:hypothetical protein
MTRPNNRLQQILTSLFESGVIPHVAPALEANKSTAADKLRHEVLAEIPAFSVSGNPEILPGLGNHVAEHAQEILRLFAGGEIRDFEFIRSHARQRAEQRFPLEAMLEAYRCGLKIRSPILPSNTQTLVAPLSRQSMSPTHEYWQKPKVIAEPSC